MPEETEAQEPTGGDTPETSEAGAGATEESAGTTDPAPESNITFSLVSDTDPDSDGSNDEPAQVPSYRLREEADRRREAERRADMLQTQLLQQHQSNGAPAQPPADPEEGRLAARFGTPEQGGPEAYEAVKETAQREARAILEAERQRIRAETSQQINTSVGGVTAAITNEKELENMKASGLIDDAGQRMIQAEMANWIQQNPNWGLAENQPALLDRIYMQYLKSGRIKPRVGPPPTRPGTPSDNGMSPNQAGGHGGGPMTPEEAQEANDEQLRTIQRQFSKDLGHLTIEQLRELDPGGAGVGPGATTRYIHTR